MRLLDQIRAVDKCRPSGKMGEIALRTRACNNAAANSITIHRIMYGE